MVAAAAAAAIILCAPVVAMPFGVPGHQVLSVL